MKTLILAVNIDRTGGAPLTSYRRRTSGAALLLFLALTPPVFPHRRGAGVKV
jgi:hypothetical protein